MEMLADNPDEYIPKFGALQMEILNLKKTIHSEVKQLRAEINNPDKEAKEEMSRFELDNLRRALAQLDHSV